jgi:UDPglucose 6-dehydrogenase
LKLSVIGAGYVGLVTAACFADKGYDVKLSTYDPKKMNLINQSIPTFHETGLQEILKRTVDSSRLQATLRREDAILGSDITFVAVGTPSRTDGSIDLRYIKDSSVEIGKAIHKKEAYHLVVIRSTVVPGTTENLVKPIIEKYSRKMAGRDFGLLMQPEFLRQGSAIYDTLNPDRIIIGEHDTRSGEKLENFYKDFYTTLPPILHTNLASAEMIKYASNAFLATKISYMNEIANICETIPGLDVSKVAEGMGLDQRIGKQFLAAGAGFGGSCFPKDAKAFASFARSRGYKTRILESVLRVNRDQTIHIIRLARNQLKTLKGKRIAVLGLSFKPGTDDIREAPSLRIIKRMLREGARVIAYDPAAIENARKILAERIAYADSVWSCLQEADAVLIVTEWEEFKKLTPLDFRKRMKRPVVIDARRIYDPALYAQDLTYIAVGLGKPAFS